MTKQPSDDDNPSLGEAARAKRDAAGPKPPVRGDRTTLNVDDLPAPGAGPDVLGEVLVERGLISRHQLFNALNESYTSGHTLREALVALGYVTEEALKDLGL